MRIIALYILFCCLPVFSQDNITWTHLERKSGSLLSLLTNPDNPEEFYALRWSGGNMFGSYRVSRHEKMEKVANQRLKIYADNSIAKFEGIKVFNNELIVFLSDKKEGKNVLYMQRYDKDIKPINDATEIASFDLDNRGYKGWFRIILSDNNDYLGAVWHIPGKRTQQDKYGFKIFNRDLEVVNDGDYSLPFEPEMVKVHSHLLSDTGDYFLSFIEYQEADTKKLFGPDKEFKAFHIYHIAKDGLQEFNFQFGDKIVAAVAMSTNDDNIFTFTGVYSEKGDEGVKGVFFRMVNLATGETLKEGEKEFDPDFITQGWTERELSKAEKRQKRGKGGPALYNYQMKEAAIQPDGSIIGTMEQYYIEIRNSYDPYSGQNSNSYYYHYNDIIAYKVDLNGEFVWIKKIRKYQISTNDGGPFSSYEAFITDNKLHFIFNDNIGNYDESGKFDADDRLYSANYTKRKNTVALASIDLETGDLKRNTFFDISEINAIAVPKLFAFDKRNDYLLLYAIWSASKEKFGMMKIEN